MIARYAAFTVLAAAGGLAAAARPFELYQPIIDRCPFGDPPDDPSIPPDQVSKNGGGRGDGGEEAVEISKEQEQLEKAVRVSVINIAPGGTVKVGFSDLSDAKQPKHFYLSVGESKDGWLVKEADPVAKTALLVKDGTIEIDRKLGEMSSATVAKGAGKADAKSPASRSPLLAGRPGGPESMKSIRQQKREIEEEERRERLKMAEDAKRREEEEDARRAQEKAEREEERKAMRESLDSIKEELKRTREEAKRRAEEERASGGDDDDDGDDDDED